MSKKVKVTIITLFMAAALLAGAVFSAVKFKKPLAPAVPNLPLAAPAENAALDISLPGFGSSDIALLSPEPAAGGSAEGGQSSYKTCAHAGYGFSFACPVDWISDLFKDDGGEVAVIQNADTGILIYIYPFDEPGPITKERILKDVPDMALGDSRQIKIAGTIDALSFSSHQREMGETKEVWFTHKNFLYQISAAEGSGEALAKLLATWKFN